MVYGKRNWMHGLPLKLAVGVINYDGEEYVVCAPVEAIKAHTDRYIVIRPGSMKKGELVKKLRGILKKWGGYEVREEDLNAILAGRGGRDSGSGGLDELLPGSRHDEFAVLHSLEAQEPVRDFFYPLGLPLDYNNLKAVVFVHMDVNA